MEHVGDARRKVDQQQVQRAEPRPSEQVVERLELFTFLRADAI